MGSTTWKDALPYALRGALQRLRFRIHVAGYRSRRTRHSYGGFPLEVCLADPIGEGWYDHDWPELPEMALLRQGRLVSGARVFNLGAHQCVVALMLARTVGPAGSVIAVEASAFCARIGRCNRDANGASTVEVMHAVVAERSGRVGFNEATGMVERAPHWWSQPVEAVSIDDLTARYGAPDVVYMDIEGSECQALRGAKRTLAGARPDCFVEVHADWLDRFGGSVDEVLSHFRTPNYRVFLAAEMRDPFRPLAEMADLPSRGRFMMVALGRPAAADPTA